MNMYLDLNHALFQYFNRFGCNHFFLNGFGLELMKFFKFFITFGSVLGLQVTVLTTVSQMC